MLNIERRNLGPVSLLNLEGNVVIGETGALHDIVQSLPPTSSVVLDLSRVRLVDAHGLGVLLQVREQSRARGMELQFTNVSNQLREVFRITRLDAVFQIRSGVEFFSLPARQRRTLVAA